MPDGRAEATGAGGRAEAREGAGDVRGRRRSNLEKSVFEKISILGPTFSDLVRVSYVQPPSGRQGDQRRPSCRITCTKTLSGPISKPIGPIGTFYGTLFIVCEPPETMGTFVARLGTRRAAQKPKRTFRYRFHTDRAILFQNILRLSYMRF